MPNCEMRGRGEECGEPESPNEGSCLRYVMNRNRQMGSGV